MFAKSVRSRFSGNSWGLPCQVLQPTSQLENLARCLLRGFHCSGSRYLLLTPGPGGGRWQFCLIKFYILYWAPIARILIDCSENLLVVASLAESGPRRDLNPVDSARQKQKNRRQWKSIKNPQKPKPSPRMCLELSGWIGGLFSISCHLPVTYPPPEWVSERAFFPKL